MDDRDLFPLAIIDVDAISWGEALPSRKKTAVTHDAARPDARVRTESGTGPTKFPVVLILLVG
jgi:hypothetical protein